MTRRVVVTGLGAVVPVGNTVNEAWENLKAGQSGISLITRFDTSKSRCRRTFAPAGAVQTAMAGCVWRPA